MVISFVIVDVVNIKPDFIGWSMFAALLTSKIVPLANFAFEFWREFVVVLRANGIRKAAGDGRTCVRAKAPMIHVWVDKRLRSFKASTALFTGQCHDLLRLALKIALARTESIVETRCMRAVHYITFGTLLARQFNAVLRPFTVTLARTEHVIEPLGMKRRTMNHLAAISAWFIPARVGAFTRTVQRLTLFDLKSSSKERLTARLTDALNLLNDALSPASARAELLDMVGHFKYGVALRTNFLRHCISCYANPELVSGAAGQNIRLCQRVMNPLKPYPIITQI